LPFHALYAAQTTLLDTYLIDYAPSFSVLHKSWQRAHTRARRPSALVVANPDGSLEYSSREAELIRQHYEKIDVLEGKAADVEHVIAGLATHDILHIACHAQFGKEKPDDIALQLAPTPSHNGRLTLEAIISRALVPEGSLVVLSACRTGRTILEEADEFVGLPSGFLIAGASALVGSLWPVDDISTALLMYHFHEQLAKGYSVAKSLKSAQLWLQGLQQSEADQILSDRGQAELCTPPGSSRVQATVSTVMPYSHPYYWAGFFVMGYW